MFDSAEGGYLISDGSIRSKGIVRADDGFFVGGEGGVTNNYTVATGPNTTITLRFSGGLFVGAS